MIEHPDQDHSPQIVVVGSHAPGLFIRVHRPPVAGENVMGWDYQEPVDGGKGSNQAVAAARLGSRVSFVGCVGQDRLGDNGERYLREAGVDTKYLKRSPSTATIGGFVMLDQSGIPAIVSAMGANGDLTKNDVETALHKLKGAKVMLTQFEIFPEVALHAAQVARDLGMTVLVNTAPAPDGILDGLGAAHILTPNESEAKTLLGLNLNERLDEKTLAQELLTMSGSDAVLMTVGERGIVAADQSGVWQVRPPQVEAVDTTGAGDAFSAALAVGLVEGLSLRESAVWGCAVAAYSVTKPGTIPIYPDRLEVEAFCTAHNYTVNNYV
jgi:ribokinase